MSKAHLQAVEPTYCIFRFSYRITSLNPTITEYLDRMMVRCCVDVNALNASEQTPLHKATVPDSPEAARLLLEAGADVNAVNFLHNPPIYYAILTDNADMVALLLAAGADITIRSTIHSETMVEYAERKGNQEIIGLFEGSH